MSRTGAELGENLAIPVFEEGKTKGQSNSKMPKDSFSLAGMKLFSLFSYFH